MRHCLTNLAMFLSISEYISGRPGLTLGDLIDTGHISIAELGLHCHEDVPLRSTTFVYPVSRVWPMGYSWSSFIAQNCMLAVCRAAMLTDEKCLSLFCFGDDSHQRDARHSHHREDRRDAENWRIKFVLYCPTCAFNLKIKRANFCRK